MKLRPSSSTEASTELRANSCRPFTSSSCEATDVTCITKLAESQASEQTLMAISGHVSRRMIEHYSHIRMDAKRTATDAIVDRGVNQNVNQLTVSDSKASAKSLN
jgi:hypothetical protein